MLLREERQKVITVAKKARDIGLVPLTFGNFSLKDRKTGYFCITPSGMDYGELYPEDIVVVDPEGNIIEGLRKPSVEMPMHRLIYKNREDVFGICHTHSTYATAWASCDTEFPVLVAELAALVGDKLAKAPYCQFGTLDFAEKVAASLQDKQAVLLSNHGLLAVGRDLDKAYANAVVVEEGAKIAYLALNIGKPLAIAKTECRKVRKWVQKNYGQ